MVDGVDIHHASDSIGFYIEHFKEELEKQTDWELNDDYELVHKTSGEKFEHDDVGLHDTGEDYMICDNNFKLMQFTGIQDKNGNDVYEDYRVRNIIGDSGFIYFDKSHAAFMAKYEKSDEPMFLDSADKDFEVTSCIHHGTTVADLAPHHNCEYPAKFDDDGRKRCIHCGATAGGE